VRSNAKAHVETLSGELPTEIEQLAQARGLAADWVYEIYLAEYARIARTAKIMSFVSILAWRAMLHQLVTLQDRVTSGRIRRDRVT
jgi:hypothetical protein